MNKPAKKRSNHHRRPNQRAAAGDLWRTPAPLPPVEPITVPHQVGALLHSLGDAPVPGDVAPLLSAVIGRAAALASALAMSADLLADDPSA